MIWRKDVSMSKCIHCVVTNAQTWWQLCFEPLDPCQLKPLTSFFHSHKIYMHTTWTTTLIHQILIWKCLGIEIWKFTWSKWFDIRLVKFAPILVWTCFKLTSLDWFKFGLVKIRDLIQISFKQSNVSITIFITFLVHIKHDVDYFQII